MTVNELIAELKRLPGDARIMMREDTGWRATRMKYSSGVSIGRDLVEVTDDAQTTGIYYEVGEEYQYSMEIFYLY